MKNLIFICLSIIPLSCCKNSVTEDTPSECLQAKLEEFKVNSAAKTIKTQTIEGATHYWLNTDARHYDGLEYVLNEACDTSCIYCGECFSTCEGLFEYENWETIWEQ